MSAGQPRNKMCNNGIQDHCCNNVMKETTDMNGPIRSSRLTLMCKEHLRNEKAVDEDETADLMKFKCGS
jgi:hypothetical protein